MVTVPNAANVTSAFSALTLGSSTPSPVYNVVALANVGRQIRLLLAATDGYLYIYNLPGRDDGWRRLVWH